MTGESYHTVVLLQPFWVGTRLNPKRTHNPFHSKRAKDSFPFSKILITVEWELFVDFVTNELILDLY